MVFWRSPLDHTSTSEYEMAGRYLAQVVHIELMLDGIIRVHLTGATPRPDTERRFGTVLRALNFARSRL